MNRMVIRRVWKAAMRVHVARRCLSTQQSSGASSKGTSWTKVAAGSAGAVAIACVVLRMANVPNPLEDAVFWAAHRLALLLPPETAHKIGVLAADYKVFPRSHLRVRPELATRVWGLDFNSPVGLAAGFTKDAQGIEALLDAGFAFVEIGSVCKEPQPGNPEPRVFRLREDAAVINRYGFNTEGADAVEERLQRYRTKRAEGQGSGVVGVNVGKNKWVEEADAAKAYRDVILQLGKYADYLVINVSSPNTPGLRALQRREMIRELLATCQQARDSVQGASSRKVPLLVKVSPDLSATEQIDIAQVVLELGIDGIIVANTTITRPDYLMSAERTETGGLSGRPLKGISTQAIRKFYELTGGKVPIIGVGGVENGRDAFDKILAGASLVQLYTAMVYQGPQVADKINEELAKLLKEHRFACVQDAVGKWSLVYQNN